MAEPGGRVGLVAESWQTEPGERVDDMAFEIHNSSSVQPAAMKFDLPKKSKTIVPMSSFSTGGTPGLMTAGSMFAPISLRRTPTGFWP